MKKNTKINVRGNTIAILKSNAEDYISRTDIAKHKNPNALMVLYNRVKTELIARMSLE